MQSKAIYFFLETLFNVKVQVYNLFASRGVYSNTRQLKDKLDLVGHDSFDKLN